MRHNQIGLLNGLIVEEENIEVDLARTVVDRLPATEGSLDVLERSQQLSRLQRRGELRTSDRQSDTTDFDDRVEERVLLREVHRLRLVEEARGDDVDLIVRFEHTQSQLDVA